MKIKAFTIILSLFLCVSVNAWAKDAKKADDSTGKVKKTSVEDPTAIPDEGKAVKTDPGEIPEGNDPEADDDSESNTEIKDEMLGPEKKILDNT